MGCIFASFHMSGKIPQRNDLLNSIERGSAIIMAESLIILAGSWSGPHDLLGSREFIILSRYFVWRSDNGIESGYLASVVDTGGIWLGGIVRSDWAAKWSLNKVALSSSLVSVRPSVVIRGGMISCRLRPVMFRSLVIFVWVMFLF